MITILDVFLILIASIILFILSLPLIILPFSGLDNWAIENIGSLLESIEGNFIISIIGVVVLTMSLKLFSILFKKDRRNKDYYIEQWTEYGEVKISMDTIIGLTRSVCERFSGLRNTKIGVEKLDGKLSIEISGESLTDVNLPEMTENLQKKVKEHLELSTGVGVGEVKIYITNISKPQKNLR